MLVTAQCKVLFVYMLFCSKNRHKVQDSRNYDISHERLMSTSLTLRDLENNFTSVCCPSHKVTMEPYCGQLAVSRGKDNRLTRGGSQHTRESLTLVRIKKHLASSLPSLTRETAALASMYVRATHEIGTHKGRSFCCSVI